MNWAVQENYLSGPLGYLLMESQRETFSKFGICCYSVLATFIVGTEYPHTTSEIFQLNYIGTALNTQGLVSDLQETCKRLVKDFENTKTHDQITLVCKKLHDLFL